MDHDTVTAILNAVLDSKDQALIDKVVSILNAPSKNKAGSWDMEDVKKAREAEDIVEEEVLGEPPDFITGEDSYGKKNLELAKQAKQTLRDLVPEGAFEMVQRKY